MPELPEVETVKNTLKNIYVNKTIKEVIVNYENILANINKNEFIETLKNQTILSFDRFGKILIINLSKGYLLVHLRMEGKFKFDKELLDKHTHIIFNFTDDSTLMYHDVRKFGKMFYYDKKEDIFTLPPLNKLGPQAIDDIDPNYLFNKLKKIKKPIKTALLDQSIISGIGNIYADEILFASKINPNSISNTISYEKCVEILTNSKVILKEAIDNKGSTVKSFQNAHGVDGSFQNKLKVYGKENTLCVVCNNLIVKTFINKRGTHYCINCQKG